MNRENLLGRVADGQMLLNAAGQTLWQLWAELPERFPNVSLDAFIVMPNHVHGIIITIDKANQGAARGGAASGAPTLGDVIRSSNPLRRSLLIVCWAAGDNHFGSAIIMSILSGKINH